MKPVRFLPLVALAAFSLLTLKLAGMMMGEGYMLTGTRQTQAKATPDDDVPKEQDAPPKDKDDPQGDKDDPKMKGNLAAKRIGAKRPPPPDVTSLLSSEGDHRTKAEILLLTSLSKRRKELDVREREIEMHVTLMKAAEKRIDERITVLKKLEVKIQRFAKAQKTAKSAQFNRLVKMYSAMKPKGAARIFNELDKKVLLGIIENMKPQAMSAILAAMAPEKAREMTISLAGATQRQLTEKSLDELPKIQGN
jgi:flagellar motility protein MotE (MotC chaperone)